MSCKECKCNTCLRALIHEGNSSDCHNCEQCSEECDNSKYSSKCKRYLFAEHKRYTS